MWFAHLCYFLEQQPFIRHEIFRYRKQIRINYAGMGKKEMNKIFEKKRHKHQSSIRSINKVFNMWRKYLVSIDIISRKLFPDKVPYFPLSQGYNINKENLCADIEKSEH